MHSRSYGAPRIAASKELNVGTVHRDLYLMVKYGYLTQTATLDTRNSFPFFQRGKSMATVNGWWD